MRSVIVACLVALIGVGTISAQYKTDRQKAEFLLKITRAYAPDAYEILKAEDDFRKFTRFAAEEEDWLSQLSSLNTVVHETCHGYQHRLGGWDHAGIYIGEGRSIRVSMGKVYDSYEMAKHIPAKYKEEIGRYDTYIEGDPLLISRQDGIYGLLDEMAAYYHGTKADVEMLEYFRRNCPEGSYECWGEGYLSNPVSSMTALNEFRFFIAWYLKYAKQRHPEVYTDCMDNQGLRVAFTLIDRKFDELAHSFDSIREDRIASLNDAGSDVRLEEDGFLMYYQKNGMGTGRGTFLPYSRKIKEALDGELNDILTDFRIDGVTMANYADYL